MESPLGGHRASSPARNPMAGAHPSAARWSARSHGRRSTRPDEALAEVSTACGSKCPSPVCEASPADDGACHEEVSVLTADSCAGSDVDALQADLIEARRVVEEREADVGAAQAELQALRAGSEAAAAALAQLGNRQLAEIKRLARSPPDSVRRTLSATWVLLHCDRYTGKTALDFDEAKDWARVQKMLCDDGFISQVLGFTVDRLDETPHAQRYLRALFWPCGDQTPLSPGPATARSAHRAAKGSAGSRGPSRPRGHSSAFDRGAQRPAVLKPLLSVEAVGRASKPCGTLCNWILALLTEQQSHSRLLLALQGAKAEVEGARQRVVRLRRAVAEAEAAAAVQRLPTVTVPEVPKRPQTAELPRELPNWTTPTRPHSSFGTAKPRSTVAPKEPLKPQTPTPAQELPIREVLRRLVHDKASAAENVHRLPQLPGGVSSRLANCA